MFINSIFLPKTISDQKMPEGISDKISNFSHLFSNVFHIIKDDQEKSQLFNLDNLNPESIENTPNELLKVSLLSDNQSNLENINISMIVKAFLLKLNPGENDEEPVNINKVKVNNNVPKYFSLSKKEFIKEIRDIIESLKSGDIKNLGNVEISLIANGQSIKINPLSTNIDELENWANVQLKSNSDFEILVKSGQKELFVDIEPVNKETLIANELTKIISTGTDNNIRAGTKNKVDSGTNESISVLKNTGTVVSASEQPLEGMKQPFATADRQTIQPKNSKIQRQVYTSVQTGPKMIFDKITGKNESIFIEQKVQGKVAVENIPNTNSELLQEFNPGTQKGLSSNKVISSQKENILNASDRLSQKNIIAEKQSDLSIKNLSNEAQIKSNVLKSDETFIKTKMFNQTYEVKINEDSQPEKMITHQANQKTNSVSINKNTVREKIAVSDLIEKTNVKEIDVNVQKVARTSFTNSQKDETKISRIDIKNLNPENKTDKKPVEVKSSSQIIKNETVKNQNSDTTKEVVKDNAKESIKEPVTLKTNTGNINKETEKIELNSSNNSKIILKNLTERSLIDNLRTSLKENTDVTKTQFENKSVKVDLMQRRVYSQIPRIEVIADETKINSLKNPEQNFDTNKNLQTMEDPIKSTSLVTESKSDTEKQVWVKLSIEKPEVENSSEVKKQAPQQSKITIDPNNDSIKKDTKQNNFSEKESHESKSIKSQNVSVETNQKTEQKSVGQDQSVNNQQDMITNIKPEIKTEHNTFRSALHSEESGFSSHTTEMVEKIKVISSSELVREVYKVFKSGEKQSIVLRLVPKELGSIKIMLDTIDNVLTAKVEVESESVGHIIRNNVDQLKQNLLQSGVHVNSINISYHNPDQKQNGFQNQKRRKSAFLSNNDIEQIDESILSKKMGYNTYEYLA